MYMPLIQWTPSLLEKMDEFDDMFRKLGPLSTDVVTTYPALDIYQDETHVIVEAQLAGVDPEAVDVSIDNDVLTIKGSIEKQTEVDEAHYYRKEIRKGNFARSVALPAAVMPDVAEADFDQGVLRIRIPKEIQKKSTPVKINVTKKSK